ncbi:MAG: chemotaxis protein CheW [Dehalococcoidales bacterium]|nr:chemotaxis protein CheW [Dehalococcoidales bacterium]
MSTVQVADIEEQLVVFDLGDEVYGVDISRVQEIIRMQAITQVPGAPSFVEGVINLRGKIIPVIDLHRRFGLPAAQLGKSSRIVVVETEGRVIGMVVDAVSEVLRIPTNCIEPPSPVVVGIDSDYIRGIAKLEGRLVILLQLDKVLTGEQKAALQGANAA